MLEIRDLTIDTLDGRRLLTGVTQEFRPGVIAIAGANGTGKSTLLRAIATVHPIAAGRITLCDADSRKERARYLEQLIFMPQTFSAYPQLTGLEFLKYSLRIRGASARNAGEIAAAWLRRVNLESAANSFIGTYSQGMLQRLGFAYAMQVNVPVYILDEPFAGVDPESRQSLLETVFLTAKSSIVLVSTHDLEEMALRGAHIIHVKDGQLTR